MVTCVIVHTSGIQRGEIRIVVFLYISLTLNTLNTKPNDPAYSVNNSLFQLNSK